MSTEQNKALIHRLFEEGINKGNLGVVDEVIAPNYVNHDLPAPAPGAEGFKQIIAMFRTAFPNLHVTDEDRSYVQNLFKSHMPSNEKFVVVGPGAANHIKRWKEEGFAQVCDKIIEDYKMQIVFVGDGADQEVVSRMKDQMKNKGIDFSGQTSLGQLAEVLRRSVFVIANDSAIMHMASYLDVPVVAIFGPTDSNKYGPWSSKSYVVKKTDLFCAPCEKSGCAYHHECMKYIEPQEILETVKSMINELS